MTEINIKYDRVYFVDFISAIVVGTAFSHIGSPEFSVQFVGKMLLILLMLEDLFSYHTEIASINNENNILLLMTENLIIFSWYFMYESFPEEKSTYILMLVVYYVLKVIAGVIIKNVKSFRNIAYFVPAVSLPVILYAGVSLKSWIYLTFFVIVWFGQLIVWKYINKIIQ